MNFVTNNKNRTAYISHGKVTNETNSANRAEMILYQSVEDGSLHVRDVAEFEQKFSATMEPMSEVLARQAAPHMPLLDIIRGLVVRLDNASGVALDLADVMEEALPEKGAEIKGAMDECQAFIGEMALSGFFRPLVVKVQVPLSSNDQNPGCLVYNEDRSLCEVMAMDPVVLGWFGDDLKIFVKARIWADGTLQMIERTEDFSW